MRTGSSSLNFFKAVFTRVVTVTSKAVVDGPAGPAMAGPLFDQNGF